MEASPLPPSLLSRLASDTSSSHEAIASSPLPEATSVVRTSSERRLLHLTEKALTTVDTLMDCSDPKVRLSAASKVLDTSPATKPSATLLGAEASLPVAALRPIFEGLGKLLSSLSPTPSSSPNPYPTYEDLPYTIVEPSEDPTPKESL